MPWSLAPSAARRFRPSARAGWPAQVARGRHVYPPRLHLPGLRQDRPKPENGEMPKDLPPRAGRTARTGGAPLAAACPCARARSAVAARPRRSGCSSGTSPRARRGVATVGCCPWLCALLWGICPRRNRSWIRQAARCWRPSARTPPPASTPGSGARRWPGAVRAPCDGARSIIRCVIQPAGPEGPVRAPPGKHSPPAPPAIAGPPATPRGRPRHGCAAGPARHPPAAPWPGRRSRGQAACPCRTRLPDGPNWPVTPNRVVSSPIGCGVSPSAIGGPWRTRRRAAPLASEQARRRAPGACPLHRSPKACPMALHTKSVGI